MPDVQVQCTSVVYVLVAITCAIALHTKSFRHNFYQVLPLAN